MTFKLRCLVLTLVAAVAFVSAEQQDAARTMMEAARKKEVVDGDLRGAIQQYKTIADTFKGDRAVAADALVRMADCYQKLGDAQARTIYERIVREFTDQPASVEHARRQLVALDSSVTKVATFARRKLWAGRNTVFGGPSSDGRLVTYNSDGDLAIRDLGTGTSRRITNHRQGDAARNRDYVVGSKLSPNGKRIAFAWNTEKGGYQLRLIDIDGSDEQVIYSNPEVEWIAPVGWTPDGTGIVVKTRTRARSGQIAWIHAADGTLRVLKTLPWTSLGRMALSPDARHVAYDALTSEGSPNRTIFVLASDGTQEERLTTGSAVDEVFGWMPDGKAVLFRTNRRGTRELWAIRVVDGKPVGSPGLIQPEMDGIYEPLGVTKNGSLFYVQVGVVGSTNVGSIDWETGSVSNIQSVSEGMIVDRGPDWSPDGGKLAFVAHRGSDLTKQFVAIRSADSEEIREIVPSEGLLITNGGGYRWSPDGKTFLVAGNHPKHGHGAYGIDLSTGDVRLIVKRPDARVLIPDWTPDGKSVIYATEDRAGRSRSNRLFIRDLETGADREVPVGVPADAELLRISFALSPDGRTLAVTPMDPRGRTLSIVPVTGGVPRQLLEVGSGESLWITGWTPDGRRIVYQRGNIAARTSQVWSIPVEGGEPRPFEREGFRAHPDGRRIAYVDSRQEMELWAMENLIPTVEAALRTAR